MIKDQMEKIYGNMAPETIPWNMENPPDVLRDIVETNKVAPCKVLEFGCGAGNYVIFFAGKGYTATGVDISENAINLARTAAKNKNVDCDFIVADVRDDLKQFVDTYDFIYDWHVLQHIYPENREEYVANVFHLLNDGGKYLSVCFSEQSPEFGGSDKYRTTPLNTRLYFSSEQELRDLFNPYFHIEEIKIIDVPGKRGVHKSVYAFMEKRAESLK